MYSKTNHKLFIINELFRIELFKEHECSVEISVKKKITRLIRLGKCDLAAEVIVIVVGQTKVSSFFTFRLLSSCMFSKRVL